MTASRALLAAQQRYVSDNDWLAPDQPGTTTEDLLAALDTWVEAVTPVLEPSK